MKKDPNIPLPLLSENKAVDWWFAFKFNTEFFEGCGDGSQLPNQGLFGGNLQNYDSKKKFSLQYVVSSNESPILTKGKNCLGTTLNDPLGATFNQVYNGDFNYVLWNDQFYNDPILRDYFLGMIKARALYCKFLRRHGLDLEILNTQE